MNHYPNYQPPGSLWYHDHSMASTGFNVLKGLNGMYLLRDKEVEKYLPKGNYETIVFLHLSGEQKHILSDVTFKTDAYYRFRFLNSHFLKNFPDISFVDPEENEIPFTLIGQDSSFMRHPVELVSFSIASAERIDLLIKFDSLTLKKGDEIKIAYDNRGQNAVLLTLRIGDRETDPEMLNYQPPSKLNVPFKNLTDPDIHVDKVRMRPLMFKAGIWNVNGHSSYHQGES